MTRRWVIIIMSFLLLLSGGVIAGWAWMARHNEQKRTTNPSMIRFFHGRVVDQEGNPLRGAEMVVQISPFADNFLYPGHMVPARRPENKFSTYSGVTGAFFLSLREPKQVVEILEVKLPGYTWLVDWAWNSGRKLPDTQDTRWFVLDGPYSEFPIYTSDTNNPAVFVLVKDSYADPVTAMPSRGGSDRTRDGKTAANKPQPVAIPSTGPSAPQGNDAINAAIKEYAERRNAAK